MWVIFLFTRMLVVSMMGRNNEFRFFEVLDDGRLVPSIVYMEVL